MNYYETKAARSAWVATLHLAMAMLCAGCAAYFWIVDSTPHMIVLTATAGANAAAMFGRIAKARHFLDRDYAEQLAADRQRAQNKL